MIAYAICNDKMGEGDPRKIQNLIQIYEIHKLALVTPVFALEVGE